MFCVRSTPARPLAARSVAEDGVLRLPIGDGRTSPVSAEDVARVVTAVLEDPEPPGPGPGADRPAVPRT
jgi:uncharacterized protein YbjT (DUF2867 family)